MKSNSHHSSITITEKFGALLGAARSSVEKFLGQSIVSTLMILLGLSAVAFFIHLGIMDYQKYNSPFDKIDRAQINQNGLLPILEAEGTIDGTDHLIAPSLDEIASKTYMESLGPLSALSADEVLFSKIALETLRNPVNIGLMPSRLIIPSLDLYVDIKPVGYWEINFEGDIYKQWDTVDEYATGWHDTSSRIGIPGNTVISGHHNVHGKVFQNLYSLQIGDAIQVKTIGNKLVTYRVARVLILEEKFQPLESRLENARWIQQSTDERLTLVTCWPNDDNSHRVVIVALPEKG